MKIVFVCEEYIEFDNGFHLTSYHEKDCCEKHYVDFTSIIGQGYEGKEFPNKLSEMLVETTDLIRFYKYGLWFTFIKIKDLEGNIYTLSMHGSNNCHDTGVNLILRKNDIDIEGIKIQ